MADSTELLATLAPSDENKPNNLIDALLEVSRSNVVSTSQLIQKVSNIDQQLNLVTEELGKLNDRMNMREQDEVISSRQKKNLRRMIGNTVYKILGLRKVNGKLSQEDKAKRNVYGDLFFSRLYGDLYERFEVSTYEDIKATDYEDAQSFIKTWEPQDGITSLRHDAEENWKVNHPGLSVTEYLGVLLT